MSSTAQPRQPRQPSHQTYCTHRLVIKNNRGEVTWEGSAWAPWGSDPRFVHCGLCEKTEYRGPTPQEQPKHGSSHPHARPRRRAARPGTAAQQGELFAAEGLSQPSLFGQRGGAA